MVAKRRTLETREHREAAREQQRAEKAALRVKRTGFVRRARVRLIDAKVRSDNSGRYCGTQLVSAPRVHEEVTRVCRCPLVLPSLRFVARLMREKDWLGFKSQGYMSPRERTYPPG